MNSDEQKQFQTQNSNRLNLTAEDSLCKIKMAHTERMLIIQKRRKKKGGR